MIAIIDYKAGNLTSVKRALDSLSIDSIVTDKIQEIESADRIIFPGVGHASSAVHNLRNSGLDHVLVNIFNKGTPILGICLGTQIILSYSEEGETECLDIIKGKSIKFSFNNNRLKIPHMGWNTVSIVRKHFLLKDYNKGDHFYFVHSFYPLPEKNTDVFAKSEYGNSFPCAIGKRNLFATQFHPEKSGDPGLRILKNFSVWDGTNAG